MAMRRRAYGEREKETFAENTRIGETPMTLSLESTNLRGAVVEKLLTALENASRSRDVSRKILSLLRVASLQFKKTERRTPLLFGL